MYFIGYAIYIVGVNRPVLKSVATLKVTFYVLLFGLLLYVVRLACRFLRCSLEKTEPPWPIRCLEII